MGEYRKCDSKALPTIDYGKTESISKITPWTNKEEARVVFKQLLDEIGIGWKATWEEALKLFINDFRYNNTIESIQERKLIFIEWSKQKERMEREDIKDKQKNARNEFLKLLESSNLSKSFVKYSCAEVILKKE